MMGWAGRFMHAAHELWRLGCTLISPCNYYREPGEWLCIACQLQITALYPSMLV